MNIADIIPIVTSKLIPFILGLAGVGFVIAFHEFGHLIFCKIFNIKVPSFSIGFGPRLITKKIGETEYSLSAMPLGGYVEIAGSAEVGQGDQAEAYSTDDRAFGPRPWIQKFLVMMGGIGFNILFAYFTFSLLYMVGMPKSMILYPKNATQKVATVLPDSPAAQAGIMAGDTILSINEASLTSPFGPTLIEVIQAHPQESLHLVIEREGKTQPIDLFTKSTNFLGKQVGSAGIIFETTAMKGYSFTEAIRMGIALTHEYIHNTINGFRQIFAQKSTAMVAGPIRIIAETMNGAREGFKSLLIFLAVISISLAIMNLIPIPILDGGQILYYTIESITGRSIPDRIREYIHIACWIGFLILVTYLSFKDIARLLQPYVASILAFFGWCS